jgi:hypothetical protein
MMKEALIPRLMPVEVHLLLADIEVNTKDKNTKNNPNSWLITEVQFQINSILE